MYKHSEKLKTLGMTGISSSYQFLKTLPHTLEREIISEQGGKSGTDHAPQRMELSEMRIAFYVLMAEIR